MEKIILIHGDVTLYEAKEIPPTATKIEWRPRFVLEKGEGVHTHTIETECDIYLDNGRMYFRETVAPIQINHEEHGLQTIPAKIVYKDLEQEFDYESMEARDTRD